MSTQGHDVHKGNYGENYLTSLLAREAIVRSPGDHLSALVELVEPLVIAVHDRRGTLLAQGESFLRSESSMALASRSILKSSR